MISRDVIYNKKTGAKSDLSPAAQSLPTLSYTKKAIRYFKLLLQG